MCTANGKRNEKQIEVAKNTYDVVTRGILCAIEERSMDYYTDISERYPGLPLDKVMRAAVRACALHWMRDNYSRKAKYDKLMFYTCYNDLFGGGLFKAKASLQSFCKHMLYPLMNDTDIILLSIDGKWKGNAPKRRSPFQVALLRQLYIKNISKNEAYRKLCTACLHVSEKAMSRTNVRIIFREFDEETTQGQP